MKYLIKYANELIYKLEETLFFTACCHPQLIDQQGHSFKIMTVILETRK